MSSPIQGSTATIVPYTGDVYGPVNATWVEKRYRRGVSHDHKTRERELHRDMITLLQHTALKVPLLAYTSTLVMEEVDVSRPLWETKVSDAHIDILAEALSLLQKEGYEMRDVEVYIQPDGSLCMLDFGQVVKKPSARTDRLIPSLRSASVVPSSEVKRLEKAWATKLLPPAVPKDACMRGCCCSCCMKCSRAICFGRCGIVRKVKSLHEVFDLKWSDLELRKCTKQEWSDRNTLHLHVDRHMRWNNHTWYSGSHKMPNETYAYLYSPTSCVIEDAKPVYQTQAWKDWVIAYRSDFWRGHFYTEYQPLCAKDCEFRLPHCACGELFHGMKLVGGNLVPDTAAAPAATQEAAPAATQEPAPVAQETQEDSDDEVQQLLMLRRP